MLCDSIRLLHALGLEEARTIDHWLNFMLKSSEQESEREREREPAIPSFSRKKDLCKSGTLDCLRDALLGLLDDISGLLVAHTLHLASIISIISVIFK